MHRTRQRLDESWLDTVRRDGLALSRADAKSQSDRGIVLAAVNQCGLALAHAATELRADREIVLVAVSQKGQYVHGRPFSYAAAELQADRDFVLAVVGKAGLALEYAAPELQADRGVVLEAIGQDAWALRYSADELKADRETVLAAVSQNGHTLGQAAAELHADKEVVLAAVIQNGYALCSLEPDHELKADKEVVLAAVSQAPLALAHVAVELKADREVVLAAVSRNPHALQLAAPELQAAIREEGRKLGIYDAQAFARAELHPLIVQLFAASAHATAPIDVTCCTLTGDEIASMTLGTTEVEQGVAEFSELLRSRLAIPGRSLRVVLPYGGVLQDADTRQSLRHLLLRNPRVGPCADPGALSPS